MSLVLPQDDQVGNFEDSRRVKSGTSFMQDCENMRQAITEVFEAGFLGLEAMIMSVQPGYHAPSTAPLPSMGALRAGPGMRGTLGEIQHSMANLHLKHSASMPVHLYNPMPPQEYPNMPRFASTPTSTAFSRFLPS